MKVPGLAEELARLEPSEPAKESRKSNACNSTGVVDLEQQAVTHLHCGGWAEDAPAYIGRQVTSFRIVVRACRPASHINILLCTRWHRVTAAARALRSGRTSPTSHGGAVVDKYARLSER